MANSSAERARKWRKENPERAKQYAVQWRNAHPGYYARKKREWREKNPDKERAARERWAAKHPGEGSERKRKWREKNPDRARAYEAMKAREQWLRIIDSYELHEAHLLKRHNSRHPDKPYNPNYKARRPPTWMMHRVLWEYAGGEPTPEQRAYAIALFRSRRAQRFGEREDAE